MGGKDEGLRINKKGEEDLNKKDRNVNKNEDFSKTGETEKNGGEMNKKARDVRKIEDFSKEGNINKKTSGNDDNTNTNGKDDPSGKRVIETDGKRKDVQSSSSPMEDRRPDWKLSSRAVKLLRGGAMPLFPPGRHDWEDSEVVDFGSSPSLKWPPVNWRSMNATEKLTAWEYMSVCLNLRCGSFTLDRDELLLKFNFLALPGTAVFKPLRQQENQNITCTIYSEKSRWKNTYPLLQP
ncbi:hypothetical protein SNE40_020015 [Patella caerulea]|uniref:Uncharacterized protein n=1 Tax=Patella caerulea TaxID=87958 RepID=A0AAN8J122_PATCE